METAIAIITVFVLIGVVAGLWDRFRSDDIPERLLNVPDLDDICQEYLDLIKKMNSGRFTTEEIEVLDSDRQWTHNEILRRLGLTREDDLDTDLDQLLCS